MNRVVNAIAGRLSLRPPQRRSLEILDRITELAPPAKDSDAAAALASIAAEFPSVSDFEREFPSVCFALATGVGKTRLMGAFIGYLHLAHNIGNFFVLAPNLTIYNKLIADFQPNTPKYVFKGISEFSTEAPAIVTGDNYESIAGTLIEGQYKCKINIFNISKINSEVRGGRSPRIKRLSEYIGASYFEYLSKLPDLVLLMDESHRYRASAGVRAINDLRPVLGLELTATPLVETPKGAARFKNVIYDYPLGQAMADGFVKEPAVVTRKDFNPAGMSPERIERMKLEDGVRLHESVKVDLETYARQNSCAIVKPFVLVIARDTTHARQLVELIQSDEFFKGHYKDKVIQVDSSRSGAEEEETISRLLRVESSDEPTEIVIHVNMLKEGWDVTNLYTIVPLRAAHAKVLIEQSIGRGLRLPYGKRTGVAAVDRLNIVAHDRFQEIVDEANRPGSLLHVQTVEMPADDGAQKTQTIVSQSRLATFLGIQPDRISATTVVAGAGTAASFTPAEQHVTQVAWDVIRGLCRQPGKVPTLEQLSNPEVQREIIDEVTRQYRPAQLSLEGVVEPPDIPALVAKTTTLVKRETIGIPRIYLAPVGEVKSGFHPFELKLSFRYPAVADELWVQYLNKDEREIVSIGKGSIEERRLEDIVVFGLVEYNDISYDSHADLLYALAGQTVRHFLTYLTEDETRKVLRLYRSEIACAIHVQMQEHYWEQPAGGYETRVSQGFSDLKPSAYTAWAGDPVLDYRYAPADKSNMSKYLFTGFEYCLYHVEKFQSDTERRLAVILERERVRWFKPVKGQFQLYYRAGSEQLEYQPDFVAETDECVYMLEPKALNAMTDPIVIAKREAAVRWCALAGGYNAAQAGKPWKYVLIPHDAVADNMSLQGLATVYACS